MQSDNVKRGLLQPVTGAHAGGLSREYAGGLSSSARSMRGGWHSTDASGLCKGGWETCLHRHAFCVGGVGVLPAQRWRRWEGAPTIPKRKRLLNQNDIPTPHKAQKTLNKRECPPTTASVAQSKKRKTSVKTLLDPVDSIPPEDIGGDSAKPPLRYYGCPFKYDQVLEYAKRHHLYFSVIEQSRHLFGGKEEMDFADLSEEHYSDPKLMENVRDIAALLVCTHLAKSAGFHVDVGYPLCKEFDGVMYVWDNYNIEERFDLIDFMGTWDDGVHVFEEAMTEIRGQRSKLQWWHSWQNWRLKG